MKIFKKIVFPLISLFLGYQSIALLRSLMVSNPNQLSTSETLIVSFLLTLFITGVFAFIGFEYPSNKLLPERYYEIKSPKKLIYTSKLLGVEYFQFLLLIMFWGRKNNRKKYFNGTKSGLNNFIFQTKQSEFGHFGAFMVIFVFTIVLLAHQYFLSVICITLINLVGNLYPIILQRIHRARIVRIMHPIKPE